MTTHDDLSEDDIAALLGVTAADVAVLVANGVLAPPSGFDTNRGVLVWDEQAAAALGTSLAHFAHLDAVAQTESQNSH